MTPLSGWLGELDARNVDNVARTHAYLELYAWTVANPPELPWVLMAHLVSRNAGYLMTDLARSLTHPRTAELPGYSELAHNLFELLERANHTIFWDAWNHVICWRSGAPLAPGRTTAFARQTWARFESEPNPRRLVLDLVVNEQNLIEHRVVHHPRFEMARQLIGGIEAAGREKPVHLPGVDVEVRVGNFASLDHRIRAGTRLYDEVLAEPTTRRRLLDWALEHPHTGSRAVAGGRDGPTLREAWPADRVLARWPEVHQPPEPDPHWP